MIYHKSRKNTIRQQGFAIRHEPAKAFQAHNLFHALYLKKKGKWWRVLTMDLLNPERQVELGNALKAKWRISPANLLKGYLGTLQKSKVPKIVCWLIK